MKLPNETRKEALKALADYNKKPYDLELHDITFAELYERWCKYKFKDEPVKGIYVAAYKIHKPFTEEELQILWNNTDDVGARIALVLCYTGLRPTELLEIKTKDVYLAERYMRGGVKTAAGKNRVIPIAEKDLSVYTSNVQQ